MFRSRQAQKRVEIYDITIKADGYGGNVVTHTDLLTTRWAKLDDMKASSYMNEAGITDFTNTYKFIFRYDANFVINPKNHILKYDDYYYEIIDVKTDGFKKTQQIVLAKQVFNTD